MATTKKITIEVVEGRTLAPKDVGGTSDPYIIVSIGKLTQKTKYKRKQLNPAWNETFIFEVPNEIANIHVECWDKDWLTSDDFMGQFDIKCASLLEETDKWFALQPRPDKRDEVSGQIHLKISLSSVEHSVALEDFETKSLIGAGTFGKVYLVTKKDSGKVYAMKALSKKMLVELGEVDHTITEKNILMGNSHPFLVNLKFSFSTETKLYFIMDYINGGELFTHLRKAKFFHEEKAKFYASEILLALEHLHLLGIIYRDLKLENILIDNNGHIRLTDFGLAKDKTHELENGQTSTFCGTPEYIAPEILKNHAYGKEVDWWSYGILVYELMTGQPPFANKNQRVMFKNILKGTVRYPESMSREAQHIIAKLLAKNPTKRLGYGPGDAADIKKHPWFKGTNWDKVLDRKVKPPFVPKVKKAEDTAYVHPSFLRKNVSDVDVDDSDGPGLSDSVNEELFKSFDAYVSPTEVISSSPVDEAGKAMPKPTSSIRSRLKIGSSRTNLLDSGS